MRVAVIAAQVVLGVSLLTGVATAGPTGSHGPWTVCPNNSSICASQLGADTDPTDEDFDCVTRNGRPGVALQNVNSGRVHCWAV